MMPNRVELNRLISELSMEVDTLKNLEQRNRKAQDRIDEGADDELDWAALGYTIHNIYNALENYFIRIAKFFENELGNDSWHRDLVQRMTLDIPEVRPAFFDRETAGLIHELRAFRHVFRNIYQTELDPEKVELVQKRVTPALSRFYAAHHSFVGKMEHIRDRLEE